MPIISYLWIGYISGFAVFAAILAFNMLTRFTTEDWQLFKSTEWYFFVIALLLWPICLLNPMILLNPLSHIRSAAIDPIESFIANLPPYKPYVAPVYKLWENPPKCSAYLQYKTKDSDGMKVYGQFLFHVDDLKKDLKSRIERPYRLNTEGEKVYYKSQLDKIDPAPAILKPEHVYFHWLTTADENNTMPTQVPNEWENFETYGYVLIKKNIGKIKCLACDAYVDKPEFKQEHIDVGCIHVYKTITCNSGHKLYSNFDMHIQMGISHIKSNKFTK